MIVRLLGVFLFHVGAVASLPGCSGGPLRPPTPGRHRTLPRPTAWHRHPGPPGRRRPLLLPGRSNPHFAAGRPHPQHLQCRQPPATARPGSPLPPQNAPKRCHAFVFGLLLTPDRLPHSLPQELLHRRLLSAEGQGVQDPDRTGGRTDRGIGHCPTGHDLVVLGDAALFDAACIQRACRDRQCSWIVPGNAERVLAGPKPRPKCGRC